MISFPMLGKHGRLGNQLFQYAFIRITARRLGTRFYCPKWYGDDIFLLLDEDERAKRPAGIIHYYNPEPQNGFTPEAFLIADSTEVEGFFQSEKYYTDNQLIKKWYTFRDEVVKIVNNRYGELLKSDCVSLSLRIDTDYEACREWFPLYPLKYYQEALGIVKPKGSILIFSDRPDLARIFFQPVREYKLTFIDDLSPSEQLYFMTRCRSNIITNSSFAWWGAWLNNHPDRIIVTPKEWCRTGIKTLEGILCEDWIAIPGIRPIWDHTYVWRIRHPIRTFKRKFKMGSGKN